MDIKERLIHFIKYKGIPISRFEEICSLSNGYVSSIRKSLGIEKLENVLKSFPDLNRDWLLYGEGEMLQNEKKVLSLPQTATQLELDFSKVVDACHKAADSCQRVAITAEKLATSNDRLVISNDKLVDNNAKLIDKLITSIDRLEKKIDKRGAAEDAKNVVKKEEHG